LGGGNLVQALRAARDRWNDLSAWPSWNPDVKSMEFEGPLGARLDVPLEVLIASRGFIPSLLKGYSRKSCSVA